MSLYFFENPPPSVSCGYRKPHLYLGSPLNELENIKKSNRLLKTDLKSCYHQFILKEEDQPNMAFTFKGQVYYYQVMPLGPSVCVYIAQKTQRFSCDYFSLKYNKWAFVFIDDILSEPGDTNIDEVLEKQFGYIFSQKKRQEGEKIEFCGFEINASDKTLKIKEETAETITAAAKEVLEGTSPHKFQKFCGKIVFASQVSTQGRTNTFYMNKALASYQRQHKFLPKTGTVPISEDLRAEIQFWGNIKAHPEFKFEDRNLRVYPFETSTDASGSAFGVRAGPLKIRGKFEQSFLAESIQAKETFALHYFITKIAPENTDMKVLVDNQALKHSFDRKYSANEASNKLLKQIYASLAQKNQMLSLVWIPTTQMAAMGADGLTRDHKTAFQDQKALSSYGGRKLRGILGSKAENCIDLFSSSVDNPLEVDYCHVNHDVNDPKALGLDAFEYLEKSLGKPVGKWLYIYWRGF